MHLLAVQQQQQQQQGTQQRPVDTLNDTSNGVLCVVAVQHQQFAMQQSGLGLPDVDQDRSDWTAHHSPSNIGSIQSLSGIENVTTMLTF